MFQNHTDGPWWIRYNPKLAILRVEECDKIDDDVRFMVPDEQGWLARAAAEGFHGTYPFDTPLDWEKAACEVNGCAFESGVYNKCIERRCDEKTFSNSRADRKKNKNKLCIEHGNRIGKKCKYRKNTGFVNTGGKCVSA